MLPHFQLFSAQVDLVLLLVVLWASLRELDEALLWGLLGGAFCDLLSAAPFGVGVLTMGVVAVLAGIAGAALRRTHALLLLALAPLATIAFDLLLGIVLESQGWPIDWPGTVALVVLPGSLVNTLATPFVYWFLRAADGWFQPRVWLA